MILSVARKFVFIKGYKVAGTSIEIALARFCGPNDIITPLLPVDELRRVQAGGACRNYSRNPAFETAFVEFLATAAPADLASMRPPTPIFYNHMSLREVAQLYPGSLSGFKLVCAERSPYAKVISWLNMQNSIAAYRGGGDMKSDPEALRETFDRASGGIGTVKNIGRYRDDDGRLTVRVIRYETLQRDFDAFLTDLGVAPVELPHAKMGLMSNSLDPRDVFRRDQIDAINAIFDEEFSAFGYEPI